MGSVCLCPVLCAELSETGDERRCWSDTNFKGREAGLIFI
jgi:hypothetical protein